MNVQPDAFRDTERTVHELPSTLPKDAMMCFATSFCRVGSSVGWFSNVSIARISRVVVGALPFIGAVGTAPGVPPTVWSGFGPGSASLSLSGTWKTTVDLNSKVSEMCSAFVSVAFVSRRCAS